MSWAEAIGHVIFLIVADLVVVGCLMLWVNTNDKAAARGRRKYEERTLQYRWCGGGIE